MRSALAVLAVSLLVVVPVASAQDGPPRAADLEAKLVCPTCHATLDQSDSPIARRMKAYIRQRIDEGASAEQIMAEMVDQFGRSVLAEPPKRGFDLLAWALPIGGVGVGAVVLGGLAWSWSRRRPGDPTSEPAQADPDLERRVDEALARLDR